MARMRDARSGRDPLSMPQLALLEEHIAASIAPVKERLVSQMDRASGGDGSSSLAALTLGTGAAAAATAACAGGAGATRGRSGSGGSASTSTSGGTRHEAGVTDGEDGALSTSRSSSMSSGMGGGFGGDSLSSSSQEDGNGEAEAGPGALVGGGGRGEEEEDEWSVGMELSSDVFGTGGSVSLGLVSPAPPPPANPVVNNGGQDCCSSSSSSLSPFSRVTSSAGIGSSFSRLCCRSGGVGGVCGGGGFLDLVGGGGSRTTTPVEQNRAARRDHLDMLSQLEAEGVFAADDSYSPYGRLPGTLGEVAFSPFVVPGTGKASSSSCSSAISPSTTGGVCRERGGGSGGGGGDDDGCGDLSPVPLREVKREREGEGEEAAWGGGQVADGGAAPRKTEAASVLPLKSAVKQELFPEESAVDGGIGATVLSASSQAVEAKLVGLGTTIPTDEGMVAPGTAAASSSGSSDAVTPFIRPKCEPAAASTRAAAANVCPRADAGEARAAKPVAAAAAAAAAEEGEPTTPVFSAGDVSTTLAIPRSIAAPGIPCATGVSGGEAKMAAAVAPVTVAPSSKPLPPSAGGGRGGGNMLLVPPRPAKRRRSSTLPAALLQPREVRYQCGACSQSYAATVTGNPWCV